MSVARTSVRAAVLALSALSLLSCASSAAYSRAVASMKAGDSAGAVLSAAESLSHSAKNYKALALLESAFPAAVAERKSAAAAAAAGGDERRWEAIVACWEAIHAMNDAVSALPPLYRKGSRAAVSFSFEYDRALLADAREKAAAYRYGEGVGLLSLGRRSEAREAFESFRKALAYRPGYKDAEEQASRARELGADKIAVVPFDSRLRDPDALGFLDTLYGVCQSALVQAAKDKLFVQVVERARLEAVLAEAELSSSDLASARFGPEAVGLYGANILVFGQLLSFSAEYPQVRSASESFQVEVEEPIKGAAAVNGKVPTAKVKKVAVVTTFTKASSVSASVAYRAVDIETSVLLTAETRSDSLGDKREWAVLTGDKEAVPERLSALLAAKDEGVLLPSQLMPRLASRLDGAFASSFLGPR
jgi:tetratricopeptide (TPR) repeat protein